MPASCRADQSQSCWHPTTNVQLVSHRARPLLTDRVILEARQLPAHFARLKADNCKIIPVAISKDFKPARV